MYQAFPKDHPPHLPDPSSHHHQPSSLKRPPIQNLPTLPIHNRKSLPRLIRTTRIVIKFRWPNAPPAITPAVHISKQAALWVLWRIRAKERGPIRECARERICALNAAVVGGGGADDARLVVGHLPAATIGEEFDRVVVAGSEALVDEVIGLAGVVGGCGGDRGGAGFGAGCAGSFVVVARGEGFGNSFGSGGAAEDGGGVGGDGLVGGG